MNTGGSSAVAERSRDASCLSVFNWSQKYLTSTVQYLERCLLLIVLTRFQIYQCTRINCVLFSSVYSSTDINEVDVCCYQHIPRSKLIDNTRHCTSRWDIGRKSRFLPQLGGPCPCLNIAITFGVRENYDGVATKWCKNVWKCVYSFRRNTWQTPEGRTPHDSIGRAWSQASGINQSIKQHISCNFVRTWLQDV